jgi:hypothetical protein
MNAKLIRYHFGLKATLGVFKLNVAHSPIYTLELPWRENKDSVSCIPEGIYTVEPYSSEKFPNVYQIKDVPNRDAILMHIGNHPYETQGCVLLGMGVSPTTPMVSNSRLALDLLRSEVGNKPFILTITNL